MRTQASTLFAATLALAVSAAMLACGPEKSSGPKVCRKSCSSADDCGPLPSDWSCTNGGCRPEMCSNQTDCIAEYSGWQMEGCKAGNCMTGDVCIRRDGVKYCAGRKVSGKSCSGEKSPLEVKRADGQGTVEVCANQNVQCSGGECIEGSGGGGDCSADGDCAGGQSCKNGECRCSSDSDCSAVGDNHVCVEK